MEYSIDLGAWNSVFAVPSVVVDKHIRLAGAAQLKVLLCFLRHAGESVSTKELSSLLNMQQADVRDCLQYWIQTGVIAASGDKLSPPSGADASDKTDITSEKLQAGIEKASGISTPLFCFMAHNSFCAPL